MVQVPMRMLLLCRLRYLLMLLHMPFCLAHHDIEEVWENCDVGCVAGQEQERGGERRDRALHVGCNGSDISLVY